MEYEDWIKKFYLTGKNSFFQRLIFRLETEGILFALEILSGVNFPEDIKVQKEVILPLLPGVLREKMATTWQYENFHIFDELESQQLGWPDARKMIVIFLFFKRVPVDS